MVSDLSNICSYYRSNGEIIKYLFIILLTFFNTIKGNRQIIYCKKEISEEEGEKIVQRIESREKLSVVFDQEIACGSI